MTPAQHTDLIERCKALGELLRLHEAAIAEDAAFMDDLRAQLATAQAENARLREALETLRSMFPSASFRPFDVTVKTLIDAALKGGTE